MKTPALVLALLLAPGVPRNWQVRGSLLGQNGKISQDISGLACLPGSYPRPGLVVDDEGDFAQRILLRDGVIEAHQPVPLSPPGQELDAEGVAYDAGFFYVVGSHGHPRDRNRKLDPVRDADKIRQSIEAASHIYRLADSLDKPPQSGNLRFWLEKEPELAPYLDRRLDENGLTVEGLAVQNGVLYVGLRGPCWEDGTAGLFCLPLTKVFPEGSQPTPSGDSAQPLPHRLEHIPLGPGLGIRDLAPYKNGLLVLCGPTGRESGPYSVGWWHSESWNRGILLSPSQGHPEAILPLEDARLLVLSDSAPNGAPFEVDLPF